MRSTDRHPGISLPLERLDLVEQGCMLRVVDRARLFNSTMEKRGQGDLPSLSSVRAPRSREQARSLLVSVLPLLRPIHPIEKQHRVRSRVRLWIARAVEVTSRCYIPRRHLG